MDEALDLVYRVDRARVFARLIAIIRDFDLAEDALQDAFVAAALTWRTNGIPDNPAGWLVAVARRKAVDRLRQSAASERRHRAWGELAVAWDAGETSQVIVDERLRLIFTCCHPALPLDARVALTLRSLGGLTTDEIAHAFLTSESALAQRIVRAKRKIRSAGIQYRVPDRVEFAERLGGVLAVVYLIFNVGYFAMDGADLLRVDLCDEAIYLAQVLVELLPTEPEALGLSALLHFQDSRRTARIDAAGQPLTLEEQDRGKWNTGQIIDALEGLHRAESFKSVGPYQLKAAIAAVHSGTPDASMTDWATIVHLYDRLLGWEPTAIVRLNRAVAIAMKESPSIGLALLADPSIVDELEGYHLYHSARADLLRRAGRFDESLAAYQRARQQTENRAEQQYLDRRLEEVAASALIS